MHRFLFALAITASVSTASLAQGTPIPVNREGFGISFGLGGGSAGAECDFCTSDRTTALSGYLRLGGHVNKKLFIGFESNGWTDSEGGIDSALGFYNGVVQFYPNPDQGFYVKGGVGYVMYSETDGIDEISSGALGLSAGLGYDFRVGRNFSLTPYANFLMSTKGELNFNDESTGLNVSANLIQFGLGFTWH